MAHPHMTTKEEVMEYIRKQNEDYEKSQRIPPMTDKLEIEKLYSILPSDSKGKLADNPEWFSWYLTFHPFHEWAWPNIALCYNKDKNITWQWIDIEGTLPVDVLKRYGKEYLDSIITKTRRDIHHKEDNLESIELISRVNYEKSVRDVYRHYFINESIDRSKYNTIEINLSKSP